MTWGTESRRLLLSWPAPKVEYALARSVGIGQARRWSYAQRAISTKAIEIHDLMAEALDRDASPAVGNATGGAASRALELELRHVQKRYPGRREAAIPDLSLTVPAGEVCVLVGPSGSGKTTAMRLINRMIPLSGGDILLGGRSVLRARPD